MHNNSEEIARKLMAPPGIPYLEGGRSYAGVDCYGLVLLFMREAGIILPDYEYEPDWSAHGGNLLIENYWKYAKQITVKELKPGDLIMFANLPKIANHMAVALKYNRCIHAAGKPGVVIVPIKFAGRRIHSYYRMKASLNADD